MFQRALLAVVTASIVMMSGPVAAERGCGSRGGPGYRGPDGRCVGWANIGRVCGSPPTTRCTAEAPAADADQAAAFSSTHPRKQKPPPDPQ